MAQKLIDKRPLKYKLVRGLSSLHLSIVLNNSTIGLTQCNIVSEVLHNANQISQTAAEKAKGQYTSFCTAVKEKLHDELENLFDDSNLEMDSFYYGLSTKEKK